MSKETEGACPLANNLSSARSKHMDEGYYFIREEIR